MAPPDPSPDTPASRDVDDPLPSDRTALLLALADVSQRRANLRSMLEGPSASDLPGDRRGQLLDMLREADRRKRMLEEALRKMVGSDKA